MGRGIYAIFRSAQDGSDRRLLFATDDVALAVLKVEELRKKHSMWKVEDPFWVPLNQEISHG